MRPWFAHLPVLFLAPGLALCLACLGPGAAPRARAQEPAAPGAMLEPPPVRIGAIYALSGSTAFNNAPSVAGVRMGVGEVNRRGGVLGRRLEMVLVDDMGSAIGSKKAAEKAVAQGVCAIVGPAWSSHALAAARVAQQARVPMITPTATNVQVTAVGDCIFRACYTDPFQGRILAEFARRDLKAASAVMAVDVSSDYSLGLAEEFGRNFKALGGTIIQELPYRHTQEGFTDLALAVARAAPDICLIPGHDESGLIVRRLLEAGVTAVPLGGDGWAGESFMQRGGRLLRRGYYCNHWDQGSDSPVSRAFVAAYKGSGQLSAAVALAFDAVMLLADAIQRAGSAAPGAVRDALAAANGFKGVTGSFTFNAQGDPVKAAVIMAIENGQPRFYKRVEPN